MSLLKFPGCPGKELVKYDINGTDVDYCESCGGIWLSSGELNKITHPVNGDIEFCSHEHPERAVATDLQCPMCDTKLMEENFIEFSEIKIHHCGECNGIWLEKGELAAINAEIDRLKDVPETIYYKIIVFLSKLPF